MKIIDLLVNLNNFNKCELDNMPEIIKYNNKIFYFNSQDVKGYYTEKAGNGGESLFKEIKSLNDEIEILEEEKKIPEKIKVKNYDKCIHDVTHKEKEFSLDIRELQIRYNDLLDYLKSKGE